MRRQKSKKHILIIEYLLFLVAGILIGKYVPLFSPGKYAEGKEAYANYDDEILRKVEEPLHVIDNGEIKDITVIPQAFEIVASINTIRKDMGLSALTTNPSLICAAQVHARQMMSFKECKHAFSEEPNFRKRTLGCGLGSLTGSEVIYCNEPLGDKVLQNWLRSENNYRTLINSEYTKIGCDTLAKNWVCILTK